VLDFDAARRPVVSIVMVTYGGWELARQALESVRALTDRPYEVIVVDNASTDGTAARLSRELAGAQVLLNSKNHGFGVACNQGAAVARAPFLLFLNSDTIVQDGWLPPLLEALADEIVAAAGPQFLNADGSLQEAGALVLPTGGTVLHGHGERADLAEFRFRRLVDYVSAACLIVRRSLFNEIGGFDPVYGVGYYEDVDLCFTLRRCGYRVVYEPRSVVTHVRRGSQTDAAAIELTRRNQAIFSQRWKHELVGGPAEFRLENRRHGYALRDAQAPERMLALGTTVPSRDDPRTALLQTLVALRPENRVTVIARQEGEHADALEDLLALGIEGTVLNNNGEERWFKDRRFHYDTVIFLDPSAADSFGPLLSCTQPQACRLSIGGHTRETDGSIRILELEPYPPGSKARRRG